MKVIWKWQRYSKTFSPRARGKKTEELCWHGTASKTAALFSSCLFFCFFAVARARSFSFCLRETVGLLGRMSWHKIQWISAVSRHTSSKLSLVNNRILASWRITAHHCWVGNLVSLWHSKASAQSTKKYLN